MKEKGIIAGRGEGAAAGREAALAGVRHAGADRRAGGVPLLARRRPGARRGLGDRRRVDGAVAAVSVRGSRSGAPRRLAATAPEPVAASFRSGCVRQHGFVPRLCCELERLPQDLPCPTFLRQPTAPPQTFPTPATRRHRSWQPSWPRFKAKQLVVAATPRGGTKRSRYTVDALHVAYGPANDDADAPSDRLTCGRGPATAARRATRSAPSHGDRPCNHHPPAARMMAAVAAGVGGADCLWRSRPLTKEGRAPPPLRQAFKPAANGEQRSRSLRTQPDLNEAGTGSGASPRRRRAPLCEPRSGIALASAIP